MDNGKRPLGPSSQDTTNHQPDFVADESRSARPDTVVTTNHARRGAFWPLLIVMLLALLAAAIASYFWSVASRENADLQRQNTQLLQEKTTSQPDNQPATNHQAVTSQVAKQLREVSAQHECQASSCAGIEFEIERVMMAARADEASYARVEIDRDSAKDSDLYLKRDNEQAQWRIVDEATNDDFLPQLAEQEGFPADFYRDER